MGGKDYPVLSGISFPLGRNMQTELIEDTGRVLPHLDDKDIEELANQVIGKLQNMTDEEFAEVVLEAAE